MSETLRARLTVRGPLAAPDPALRSERERLCAFLRQHEENAFAAPDEAVRRDLRRLLGWDDDTFQAFITSPLVTHSSPHTGLNIFPPMMFFAWVQRMLQELSAPFLGSGRPVHLRTMVLHNNLGDLRYRPYAWWRRDIAGGLAKVSLWSRSSALRHRALMALPAPEIDPSGCAPSDRQALEMARHGRGYAWFALLYRRHIETQAGFHLEGLSLDVPLNVLAAFTFHRHGVPIWAETVERVLARPLRVVSPSGDLADLPASTIASASSVPPGFSIVAPNFAAFAHVYRLGVTTMIGAEKMARYVEPMNAQVALLLAAVGERAQPPRLIPVTRFPIAEVAPLDPRSHAELARSGLVHSLSLAVADFGAGLGERCRALLDRPYREFFPEQPASGSSGT